MSFHENMARFWNSLRHDYFQTLFNPSNIAQIFPRSVQYGTVGVLGAELMLRGFDEKGIAITCNLIFRIYFPISFPNPDLVAKYVI